MRFSSKDAVRGTKAAAWPPMFCAAATCSHLTLNAGSEPSFRILALKLDGAVSRRGTPLLPRKILLPPFQLV